MMLPYAICAAVAIAGYTLLKFMMAKRKEKKLRTWAVKSSRSKKVILHGMYGNSDILPTVSPFVLKLETFLRFARIPYEIDKADWWGEKGKTPWISYDGENWSDSQFIVELLSRKFEGSSYASPNYTQRQNGIATAARVMVEEHLYWAAIMWRFAFGGKDTFQQVRSGEKTFGQWLIFSIIAHSMKSSAWSQGMGRHSEAEVIQIMLQDLRSLSAILGKKKFICGDEPCADDCAIFSGLAAIVLGSNGPPELQNELRGNLKNLSVYFLRMKVRFWMDWDEKIEKSRKKSKDKDN